MSPVVAARRSGAGQHPEGKGTPRKSAKTPALTVAIGRQVTVSDSATGSEQHYEIVAPGQGGPAQGKLSCESPVARALSGHGRGDVVIVQLPHGQRKLRIVAVA